ncbi:MAG: phage portal protein [Mycoplasmataceae bacterium]|nr:phage portal protein [Mycoplasmataceae bacterium]
MSEAFDSTKPIGDFSAFNTFYTYSWVNNERFYALVPYPYKEYYQRFIKQYFQWYDGFVPYFHNTSSGMFSTRLAYTTLHKLAKVTIGNKLMFNDDGVKDTSTIKIKGKELNSLEFVEHWSKINSLDTKVVQLKEWAFVGGDSVIKLNNINGELVPDIVRKDNYFMSTDFTGRITDFTSLIYNYTKMTRHENDDGQENYYVLEDRKYSDSGKPQIRISIKRMNGALVTNKQVDITPETIPFERLPRDVSHKFMKDYPNTKLGEWEDLPLKDLGIYLDKSSEKVSFLPAMSGGESLLSNAIHVLMMYDYYFSSLGTNLYAAQDKIIAPQHMQTPQNQGDPYFGGNAYSGWGSKIITRIPYTNPEDNKPVIWQPDTRADQWIQVRNNLLQTLAMVFSVDDRTLSSAIVPNSEKPTAREISSDEDTTTLFAEGQQAFTKNCLDSMLDCVLDFYNFKDEEVTIKFNKAGLSNMNNVVTIVTTLKQNGAIDLKTMLEMVFKDKSNRQIENMIENIKKEKEEEVLKEQKLQDNKDADIEEKIEQTNNTDISHIEKPKKKKLFNRKER